MQSPLFALPDTEEGRKRLFKKDKGIRGCRMPGSGNGFKRFPFYLQPQPQPPQPLPAPHPQPKPPFLHRQYASAMAAGTT